MDEPKPERRGEPFVMIPTSIVRDTTLTVFAKAVYAVLASYASRETAECWPSVYRLSVDSCCSERTVQKGIAELVEAGLIIRERRTEQGSNEPKSNLYRVLGTAGDAPPTAGDTVPTAGDAPEVVQEVRVGGAGDADELYPLNNYHLNHIPVREKHPKETSEYSSEFELFWQSYPRREGKRTALKQWMARIKAGALAEEMIAGAKAYASKVKQDGRETRFQKLPATFLGPDLHFSEVIDATAQPVEQMTWARPQLFVKGAQT